MIKIISSLIAGLVLITGCSSNPSQLSQNELESVQRKNVAMAYQQLQTKKVCCRLFSEIPYLAVNQSGKFDYVIDETSPAFEFVSGKSYVQGIKLPNPFSKVDVSIEAPIVHSVFVPTVVVLDENFEPIEVLNQQSMEYLPQTFLRNDEYKVEFTLPQGPKMARYMLIFSADKDMQGETKLALPDEYADTLGRPALSARFSHNPAVPHSATGVVSVLFDYDAQSEAALQQQRASVEQIKPAVKQPAIEPVAPAQQVKAEGIEPEVKSMFIVLMRQAVNAGDIAKAERIAKDAVGAGFDDAQKVLADMLAEK
jgi:maltose operon protein